MTERERFEAFIIPTFYRSEDAKRCLIRVGEGYADPLVNGQWLTWQAALAQRTDEVRLMELVIANPNAYAGDLLACIGDEKAADAVYAQRTKPVTVARLIRDPGKSVLGPKVTALAVTERTFGDLEREAIDAYLAKHVKEADPQS